MAQLTYRPVFFGQLNNPLVVTDGIDCGPVAFRHAVRRWSLGVLDYTVSQIRSAMGKPTGQTSLYDHATAARKLLRINLPVFDRYDSFSVAALNAHLAAGGFATALGDYDEVPVALRGDKNWLGNHLVMVNELVAGNAAAPLVYDSLDDGRRAGIPKGPIVWPAPVLPNYLVNLSDRRDLDVTVAIWPRRRLKARAGSANVRAGATTLSPVVGVLAAGRQIEHGGTNLGQTIGGDRRWYRVWWPDTGQVAFVHASVALEV